MPDFEETPWRQRDHHGDMVLEMRSIRSQSSESETGTMTEEIRVRHGNGRILLDRQVTLHWKHFGQINAEFSDDGCSVVVTTTDGRDRVWPVG